MVSLPKINIKNGLLIGGGVVLVIASGYFGWQYARTQELLRNPAAKAIDETNTLLRAVRRHVVLPEGETPTVATVSDKSKLADQPFFVRAEEGDKVLIFVKDGRAILYRPSIGRVVEMTTVSQNPTPVPQLTEATVTILNGTNVVGLATTVENKLVKELKSLKVIKKDNSVGDYKMSLVVIVNPRAVNIGQQIGNVLKAEVTDKMPSGEVKPESDVVIVMGQDFTLL